MISVRKYYVMAFVFLCLIMSSLSVNAEVNETAGFEWLNDALTNTSRRLEYFRLRNQNVPKDTAVSQAKKAYPDSKDYDYSIESSNTQYEVMGDITKPKKPSLDDAISAGSKE